MLQQVYSHADTQVWAKTPHDNKTSILHKHSTNAQIASKKNMTKALLCPQRFEVGTAMMVSQKYFY